MVDGINNMEYLISIMLLFAGLTGFWGVGRTLRRAVIKIDEDLLTPVYEFAIGAWVTWITLFFLGMAGLYRPWTARLLLIISAGVGIAQIIEIYQKRDKYNIGNVIRQSWPVDYIEKILAIICLVVISLAIIGALSPTTAQDALVHHLVLPKNLIHAGRLREFPYDYFSYFPAGMEMLYLYGLLLQGASLATLFHFSFGIATFIALIACGRKLGVSRRACLIAGTSFLTVPTVWMEMTWAYVDLTLSFYVTLTILALLRFRQQRAIEWLWLCGFALGGALSIKYTALFVIFIITLLILFVLREQEDQINVQLLIKVLIVPMTIALLVSLTWFVRNIIYTGNPLFPFFLNLIPSNNVGWDVDRGKEFLSMMSRYGGENKTILDYLLLPFRLAFFARYEGLEHYQGVIGQFYLLVLPLLLLFKRIRMEARYLIAFSILFYLFWCTSSQQIRYLLPALPALSLAIAMSEDLFKSANISRAWQWLQRGMVALVMILFLVNTGVIISHFKEFKYGQVLSGKVSQDDYLRNYFDYYQFYEYINNNTPKNSKIFLIVMSNQPYYLQRDYFSDSVFEDYTIRRIVAAARTPADIKTELQKMGITHLLYRQQILFGPQTTPFSPEEGERFFQFLQRYCQPLIINNRASLFVIR